MNKLNSKTVIHFIFLTTLIFSIYSCCKTIDCNSLSKKNVTLYKFTTEESKTFIIRRFKMATNFTEKIDTLLIVRGQNAQYSDFAGEIGTNVYFNLNVNFEIISGFDYEFYFPATNTLRRITEFTDIQGQSKYCIPSMQKNTCINEFSFLKLDSVLVTGAFPAIIK